MSSSSQLFEIIGDGMKLTIWAAYKAIEEA
jgi:hypothetical protein